MEQSQCQTVPNLQLPDSNLSPVSSTTFYHLSQDSDILYLRTGRIRENFCTILDVPLQFHAEPGGKCLPLLAVSALQPHF